MSSTDETGIGPLISPAVIVFYQFTLPLILITSDSKVFTVIFKLTLGIQLYSLKGLAC